MPYAPIAKLCEECGNAFKTRRPQTRYCSKHCTALWVARLRRERDGWRRRPCSVDGCERLRHGQGVCLMHLKRLLRNGTTEATRKRRPVGMSVSEWFMSFVDKGDGQGCWVWQGNVNVNRNGYGMFYDADAKRKVYAHHYLVAPGPTLDEANGVRMEYDHLCRNVRCVRPEHLELVTATENRHREFAPVDRG